MVTEKSCNFPQSKEEEQIYTAQMAIIQNYNHKTVTLALFHQWAKGSREAACTNSPKYQCL